MAYIDVASQKTSEEILGKIGSTDDVGESITGKINNLIKSNNFTDIELIKMCTNYNNVVYDNLTESQTELLAITGSGAVSNITVKALLAETFLKAYIDNELLFDFSIKSESNSSSTILYFGRRPSDLDYIVVKNLNNLKDGIQTMSGASNIMIPLLTFNDSLKIYGHSTLSNASNLISVEYVLKG